MRREAPSWHGRGEMPGLTFPLGRDEPRSPDDVLRSPNARPAVVHGWLVGHGVVGLHLDGVVLRWGPVGPEDLSCVRAGTVLHAAGEAGATPVPVATLLMNVTKEMHLRLGTVDGVQECVGGAPVPTTRHVENPEGRIVRHQNVNACWEVAVVVAGAAVAAAGMPAGAPNLQAHDLGHLVIQNFGIGDLALKVVGVGGLCFTDPTTIQAPVGVPIVMVSCNDEHVLVLVLDGAQPVIEIPQLAIISHFGHIPRVNEDVCIWQVPSGPVQAVRVTEVKDRHHARQAADLEAFTQDGGRTGVRARRRILRHGQLRRKPQESHVMMKSALLT